MIMASRLRPHGRGTILVCSFLLGALLGSLLGHAAADAAAITWGNKGAFEACLERSLDKWLTAQAELQVNERPDAALLGDAAVAAWTVETLAQCRALGPASDPASEERFTKHMAHWRQHIYDLAADIRKKGQSD